MVSVDAAAYDAAVSDEWDSVPERDLSEEGHRVFRCDSSILGRHTRVVGDPPVVGTQKGRGVAVKIFSKSASIGVAERDGGSVTSPWVLLKPDEVVRFEIVPQYSQSK